MRTLLAAAFLLVVACESPEARLAADQPGRQRVLSEQILKDAVALAPTDGASASLALEQVRIPGHSPRLRLLVTGDDEALARGAAEALVSIRLRREGGSALALVECVSDETNAYVRAACLGRQGLAQNARDLERIVDEIDSRDDTRRRRGLQALLAERSGAWPTHPRLDGAVVHLLDAGDASVRLLASAAFLRRSLALAPPPADAATMVTPREAPPGSP